MEFRPYFLAQEWQKMGHKVLIAASSFSHLRGKQPNVLCSYEFENREGVNYFWVKTPRYEKNNIKRFINIFFFMTKLLFAKDKISEFFKPDIIIGSSTYPFDMFVVDYYAKKFSSLRIFEIHDLWPLSPVELGGMSHLHPFIIMTEYAQKYALKKADKVVSILPLAKEYLTSKGMAQEKFVHVPNGLNVEDWDENCPIPKEHHHLIERCKKENQFLIGYVGSHSISDSLETLIQSAPLVNNLGCSIILIGNGPEKEKLISLRDHLKLENVHFLPHVSKKAIPALLKLMDVLYIGWKKRNLYRYGVCPTKLLDYMMAAKPIIYGIQSGNNIVKEIECGITVEPENPKDIARAIVALQQLGDDKRKAMGYRGKQYVQSNHGYSKLAADFINSLLN
ncbi:MAG: glycosyltransferase family 4 protein [Acidobacteria bacterium]|nr:glycosyltransferase family 4 protein [Acidobacteriota bacterium]